MTNKQILTKTHSSDRVLIFGPAGSGKSASTATLLKNAPESRRLIYIMVDRNAVSGFEWGLNHYKINVEEGQVLYVMPERTEKPFTNMRRSLKAYQKESKSSALRGNKDSNVNKDKYLFFDSIIDKMEDFTGTDYATGKQVHVGSVADLDEHDIIIIDGLTPIAHEIWNAVQGDKFAVSFDDYGTPQRTMHGFFQDLSLLRANVILLAHEKDYCDTDGKFVETRVNTMVGNATYSTLIGHFSEVIHTTMFGKLPKFETLKPKVSCVARKMPQGTNLEPDFSLYNLFGNNINE